MTGGDPMESRWELADDERLDRRSLLQAPGAEAIVDRVWERLDGKKPDRARWVAGGAVLVAVAAAVGLYVRLDTPDRWRDQVLVTGPESMTVALADRSRIVASPYTELVREEAEADDVSLRLRSGRARFEVESVPERVFSVRAGDVEVRVVGTIFSVSLDGDGVEVAVERGGVDVLQGGSVERIRAGQAARYQRARPDLEPSPEPVEPSVVEPDEGEPEAEAEAGGASLARIRPAETGRAPTERVDSASSLLAEATAARRAGRLREADAVYARLLERFRHDVRAPYAALELGRLRMDELHEPRGAIEPLRLAARGTGAVAEDALARLVVAYATTGQRRLCEDARDRYLATHPAGSHNARVSGACASD